MTHDSTPIPPVALSLLSALTEHMPPASILNRLSGLALSDLLAVQAYMRDKWGCSNELLDQEITRRRSI